MAQPVIVTAVTTESGAALGPVEDHGMRPYRRREAGVKIVVSSDAHEVLALDYVEFGIAQARRAWLTADQVANTRTWAQLRKLKK